MAQQIQFIYLSQSDYDNTNPKNEGRIYFTSDTHRIYKGSDLYAATTFDQLNFGTISASGMTVDGSAVSLEGHTHVMSEITDLDTTQFASSTHTHPASEVTRLQSVLDGLSSTYALASHSHAISDITNLAPIVSGVTSSSIEKENGQFVNLNATNLSVSQLTVDATVVSANSMTVGGSNVSVEGHTHTMSEIEGLASGISGIESSISTLESSVSAMATTMSGMSETGISKQSAIFQTLTVTGEVTMSLSSVDFQNINASSLTVNGSAVSLEGHSHSASEISGLDAAISAATSSFALSEHTHNISDITSLATKVSGLTSSKVEKTNGVFTNLSTTNLVVSSATIDAISIEASSMIVNGTGTFNAVSASTATFGDINVTGTASLSTTSITASTLTAGAGSFSTGLTVGGSNVALEGHSHSEYALSSHTHVQYAASDHNHNGVYASASHSHAISDVTDLSDILSGITSSGVEKGAVTADIGTFRLLSVSGSANFAVNNVSANAVTVNGTSVALVGHTHSQADIIGLSIDVSGFASESHTHVVSDITDLETTLSAYASSGHTHDELSGLTSSTIDRLSGSFNALTASTATFGTINVTSSATFDITNLVADTITVSDLDLTGTLTVSSTAVSAMTVTDLSVTGTLMLNSKSIATQEYVQLMISQAIGQILASAY